jgi:FtsH-binding integral membrane protein
MTAYDTHRAIEEYKAGNADHLYHAVSFYLNFLNIFVRVVEIMRRFSGNQD